MILAPSHSKSGYCKSILFVQPRDKSREIWDGERYGVEGAEKVFGMDEAYDSSEVEKRLSDILKASVDIYYRIGKNDFVDRMVMNTLEKHLESSGRSGKGLQGIRDWREPVGEMRLFKSKEEIEHIKTATRISAAAHLQVMKEVRPGMNEFEVQALIEYLFRKNGCQRDGYGSIIAGGGNATCLHYVSNNQNLNDGDLLLIDAGGEFNYYTADITRTFPVGKSYSNEQAEIYELVLKAQKDTIAMAKPGISFGALHTHATEILTDGLLSLGLLKNGQEKTKVSEDVKRFYPHGTGHWLGMDVHDFGIYKENGKSRKLEPGMLLTVEPGIYIQDWEEDVPAKYKKIGIRIEDDILITENGCENLTKEAPKELKDIEALR